MKGRTLRIIAILFTGLNILLALNRHSHGERHNYHGELWADRSGYFVYLPATFDLGFNASDFPAGIDTLNGSGFRLDEHRNRVVTKYTCGVAMLQAPFYLIGHGIGAIVCADGSPFGNIDHVVVDVAAPVLLTFGLLLLLPVLGSLYGRGLSYFMLLLVFAGSNLFYYTVGDPGMSHVYSFFLFALVFRLLFRITQHQDNVNWSTVFGLGLAIGFITLIRPTNLLFVLTAPFLLPGVRQALFRSLLSGWRPLLLVASACAVWLPQFAYWQYTFGSPFVWSYGDEGFKNWDSPELLLFLFSTNNGLIPYSPLIILALWGSFLPTQPRSSLLNPLLVLTLCLLGASWWVWHFGCGFGSRTLVEYWALLIFPLAAWFKWSRDNWGRTITMIIGLFFIIHQLKMVYSFGDCWFAGDWNWSAYSQLVFGPTK